MVSDRRTAILKHIFRYGVTVRPVLERLFNPSGESSLESDLKALRKKTGKSESLIEVVERGVAESQNTRTLYSYYYLTRKGEGLVGGSDGNVTAPGGDALRRNVAILWYCCMATRRSHRLSKEEVVPLFAIPDRPGDDERVRKVLSGHHCVTRHGEKLQIQNLYVPYTTVAGTLSELNKRVKNARRIASVAEAIRAQQYAFTVLVETPEKQKELREAITKHFGREEIVFIVARSPGTWQIKETTK